MTTPAYRRIFEGDPPLPAKSLDEERRARRELDRELDEKAAEDGFDPDER